MSDEIFETRAALELSEQELEVVAGGTEENDKFVSQQSNSSPDSSSTLVFKSMNVVASAFQFIALDLNDASTTKASEK
ncbi:CTB family bacteriocin [Scytonema sp. NUACC26]|uniref:CTB family bacteriocin n=1 Tax=Scytonema sp. NUACC26 TaxID=3140176 RepID=UPI0034DC1AC4